MAKAQISDAPPGAGLLVLVPFQQTRVDGGTWLFGEVIKVVPVETVFAWADFPQNPIGEFTVQQINNRPQGNNQLYDTARVTTSGQITNPGHVAIDVTAGDSIAYCYLGYWVNYGVQEDLTLNRLHVIVEDKTVEQVALYIEKYNIKVDMETIAGPDANGFRRIQIDNLRVSFSGDGAFTQEGVDDLIAEWNLRYPESGLVEVSFSGEVVVVEGTFTSSQRVEFEEVVIAYGLAQNIYRRRWYSPQAQQIIDAGGWVSGPASSLTLRDRLLD